ncbi:DUF6132 family protein [Parabacteroides sp. OttesenSCG-928-O15]|nr:DUF6132 family protein [Parabacteroides sp. OttesenSCG-928-O15]
MEVIKNNWTYLLGALLGIIAGYLYWRFIGCATGNCPITSSPLNSSIYGAMMGAFLGGAFKKDKVKDNQ